MHLQVPSHELPTVEAPFFAEFPSELSPAMLIANEGGQQFANTVLAIGAEALLRADQDHVRVADALASGQLAIGISVYDNIPRHPDLEAPSKPGATTQLIRPEEADPEAGDWAMSLTATDNTITMATRNMQTYKAGATFTRPGRQYVYTPRQLWHEDLAVRGNIYTGQGWSTRWNGLVASRSQDPATLHRLTRPLHILGGAAQHLAKQYSPYTWATLQVSVEGKGI